jgi:hypothetical protein
MLTDCKCDWSQPAAKAAFRGFNYKACTAFSMPTARGLSHLPFLLLFSVPLHFANASSINSTSIMTRQYR